MTVTLDLNPEVEKRLIAQAHERGVSLSDYLPRHRNQGSSPVHGLAVFNQGGQFVRPPS